MRGANTIDVNVEIWCVHDLVQMNIDRTLDAGEALPGIEEIAKHTAHAKFVRDAGGLYLQVTDDRPKDRAPWSSMAG